VRRKSTLSPYVVEGMSPSDVLHWWNPRKILLQILLLQTLYTGTCTLLITFLVLLMGAPFRLNYLFLDARFSHTNVFGLLLALLSLLASAFMYVLGWAG
jgi:Integral membrane protein S linking to the trans Golgi network